jgi:structural maintenance of chromosomes protein 6
LFQFFLLGTQLFQLSQQYEQCIDNISKTAKVLHQKHEAIPDLREKYTSARARFAEAEKAREQQQRVDELKKELAWSHVAGKKRDMEAKAEEVEKLRRMIAKVEEKLEAAKVRRFSLGAILIVNVCHRSRLTRRVQGLRNWKSRPQN